ncbi:hypothetical protein DMT42_00455 [Streptomyces actuosus]|uniref:Uncharacterized protein n=1 Tax=Streptomyces actuosus TaxID=1885 RepID=A0A2U9NUL7_STRAS|nr:hypothetical protein DMT42_00455 [Streptomyces actuosus]
MTAAVVPWCGHRARVRTRTGCLGTRITPSVRAARAGPGGAGGFVAVRGAERGPAIPAARDRGA